MPLGCGARAGLDNYWNVLRVPSSWLLSKAQEVGKSVVHMLSMVLEAPRAISLSDHFDLIDRKLISSVVVFDQAPALDGHFASSLL